MSNSKTERTRVVRSFQKKKGAMEYRHKLIEGLGWIRREYRMSNREY